MPINLENLSIEDEEEESTNEWLVTYGDMVTLLLTFFVVLVSLSTLDTQRFSSVLSSIQDNLGGPSTPGGQFAHLQPQAPKPQSLDQLTGLEQEALLEDLRQELNKKNLDDAVRVVVQGDKVILRVDGNLMFASGSAALSPKAQVLVEQVAKVAKDHPGYRLDVKGHTDPRPMHSAKFDSNWELSALRATAVLRHLISLGIKPQRLTATGYADTEPLVPNTSEANMGLNRRVEFVLEKKEK